MASSSTISADAEVSVLCLTIVKVSLVFFGIFGVFGNANIILATCLHTSLRSKFGLLLALLAFCDLWSLLFELLSAYRLFTSTSTMPRTTCFWSISFYLFVENLGSYTIFAIGIDRLMAICLPIKYLLLETRIYISAIIAPGIVYSAVLLVLGAINLDKSVVPVCIPPLAYRGYVSNLWNLSEMALSVLTVLAYAATYSMLYKIAPKLGDASSIQIENQKTMVKSLFVNVSAFVTSALLSSVLICIMNYMHVSQNAQADAETYAVIPGLLSYSINYYMYFWRSSEYRKYFRKQLVCFPRIAKTVPLKKISRAALFSMKVRQASANQRSSNSMNLTKIC